MKVTVDSRGFLKMVHDLQRISGRTFEEVLRHEAARVIERAIDYTPKAVVKFTTTAKDEAAKLNRTFPHDAWPKVSESIKTGNVWMGENDNRLVEPHGHGKGPGLTRERMSDDVPTWHRMNDPERRWNQRRWDAYQHLQSQRARKIQLDAKTVAAKRKAARQAMGLTKRSWYQIGIDLKLPMKPQPRYVSGSKPSNGKDYKNGFGTKHLTSGGLFFALENNYPALISGRAIKKSKSGKTRSINGHAILQRAISTRLRAFTYEVRKGVFDDLKMRAARHPGVFVSP